MTTQNNDNENNTDGIEEEVLEESVATADEAESEQVSDDPLDMLAAAQMEAVEARQDMLRMQADMETCVNGWCASRKKPAAGHWNAS